MRHKEFFFNVILTNSYVLLLSQIIYESLSIDEDNDLEDTKYDTLFQVSMNSNTLESINVSDYTIITVIMLIYIGAITLINHDAVTSIISLLRRLFINLIVYFAIQTEYDPRVPLDSLYKYSLSPTEDSSTTHLLSTQIVTTTITILVIYTLYTIIKLKGTITVKIIFYYNILISLEQLS